MYKFQRRDKKLNKRKNQMPKHGKNTGENYKNATIKRFRKNKEEYPQQ